MFYVYILQSLKNKDIYVGSTANMDGRIKLHNSGRVRSTKANKPWQLLEYHEFVSRSEAFKKEMFYKSGQQKEILKKKYNMAR
jgi:putative endonuclease